MKHTATTDLHRGSMKRIDQCTESQIERTCTEFLQLDAWRPLRTDPCSDKDRGKGFGEIGMADHLYIRYSFSESAMIVEVTEPRESAEVLWIEWKRPGEKPTPNQIAWHATERARGALTLIAGVDFGRDAKTGQEMISAFVDWYRASGLNRGRI